MQPSLQTKSFSAPTFGSPINSRAFACGGGRYGFQGQEKINEIYGDGNYVDFAYRGYNPRLGRFFAVDPIAAKFPYNSPFAFSENQVIAFVELEGLEKATPEQQKNANDKIEAFSNDNSTTTVWENIDKASFVSSLQNMVNNPSGVEQANTNLCGIATACKAGIEYNPEAFVEMALTLYQTGEYTSNGQTYKANSGLFDNGVSNGLDAASFVIMTTLRHSLNSVLSYDPTNDNGTSGFTWPSDVDNVLIKGMSMRKTTNTDWESKPVSGNLLVGGITKAVDAGHVVILTVNTSHFMGKSSSSVIPDHYIQITGITERSDGTIDVGWWSWGGNQSTINMTKQQLYQSTYFYGSFE
jgi:RHS repeat-associated protein